MIGFYSLHVDISFVVHVEIVLCSTPSVHSISVAHFALSIFHSAHVSYG